MENSPLSDGSVAEEENTSSLESTSRHTLDRELPTSRTHSRGAGTRVGSWMRVGAVDWGIRIAVVGLVIGGFFAVYVNGVAEGWWRAWGETPTVAATGPTVQPTPAPTVSSEPAMSAPTACSCAPPSTQRTPTPNQSSQRRRRKTVNAGRKQPQNTT